MPKSPLNKWVRFTQMGLEMAIIITVMVFLGTWLDGKYPNLEPLFTVVLSLFGVFAALFNVIRKVNNLNKEEEE
ncbi:AtpZ/AtpI family protein [Zhouia sp. PK063]|uniref:AtpZ/AtpI family protein n=1 Tax=Zhouia sp. PK063 TaxID=3373602 RepID=UPI00379F92C4